MRPVVGAAARRLRCESGIQMNQPVASRPRAKPVAAAAILQPPAGCCRRVATPVATVHAARGKFKCRLAPPATLGQSGGGESEPQLLQPPTRATYLFQVAGGRVMRRGISMRVYWRPCKADTCRPGHTVGGLQPRAPSRAGLVGGQPFCCRVINVAARAHHQSIESRRQARRQLV